MKNTKTRFSNLFVQDNHSWFTKDFVHTKKGKNWSKLTWFFMKKYWKRSLRIKSWKSWMQRFWFGFFDLKPSHISNDANPIQNNDQAAPYTKNQTWVFCKKVENWKLGFRAFQDQITIPLACQGDQEAIPIKNINSNALNRYTEIKIFHIKCIIVF